MSKFIWANRLNIGQCPKIADSVLACEFQLRHIKETRIARMTCRQCFHFMSDRNKDHRPNNENQIFDNWILRPATVSCLVRVPITHD